MIIESYIKKLLDCFPGSYINHNCEFIADSKRNLYFLLEDVKTELDVKCKILEWFSRAAHKLIFHRREALNREYQDNLRGRINFYLGTEFTRREMERIYCKLGNRVNRKLCVQFIESGYDMKLLEDTDETRKPV